VFNGGAWLHIEDRRVDVHYRDLDTVEHELGEAAAGRFRIEPLLFYLAGIPTYLAMANGYCDAVAGREIAVANLDLELARAYAGNGDIGNGFVLPFAAPLAGPTMSIAQTLL
jgi:hypothetical protein